MHLSRFIETIQGKSRSWTDGAYAIFEVSRDRYVQFLSSPDGMEYLMEISSHRYVESVNNCLTEHEKALNAYRGHITALRWFVSDHESQQADRLSRLAALEQLLGQVQGSIEAKGAELNVFQDLNIQAAGTKAQMTVEASKTMVATTAMGTVLKSMNGFKSEQLESSQTFTSP